MLGKNINGEKKDSPAKLEMKEPQHTVVLAVLMVHTIFLPCQMLIPKTLKRKCRRAKALSPAGQATSDKHCPVVHVCNYTPGKTQLFKNFLS